MGNQAPSGIGGPPGGLPGQGKKPGDKDVSHPRLPLHPSLTPLLFLHPPLLTPSSHPLCLAWSEEGGEEEVAASQAQPHREEAQEGEGAPGRLQNCPTVPSSTLLTPLPSAPPTAIPTHPLPLPPFPSHSSFPLPLPLLPATPPLQWFLCPSASCVCCVWSD